MRERGKTPQESRINFNKHDRHYFFPRSLSTALPKSGGGDGDKRGNCEISASPRAELLAESLIVYDSKMNIIVLTIHFPQRISRTAKIFAQIFCYFISNNCYLSVEGNIRYVKNVHAHFTMHIYGTRYLKSKGRHFCLLAFVKKERKEFGKQNSAHKKRYL